MTQIKVKDNVSFIQGIESSGYSFNEEYLAWTRENHGFVDAFSYDSTSQTWTMNIIAVPVTAP
jgi:hypothetical protein